MTAGSPQKPLVSLPACCLHAHWDGQEEDGGVHREARRPLPGPLPRPARTAAVRDLHPQGRRRAVPAGDAGRHRAGSLDRPRRGRPRPWRLGRGVPLARPPAVAVDPGHLPAGSEALHPAQIRRLPAGRLPAGEIENWLNDEIAAGQAPSSVHRHYRTLRRLLQVAVEKEKIPSDPCDRVQPPRVPKREMVFLTWDQAVDLADAVGKRYRSLIHLCRPWPSASGSRTSSHHHSLGGPHRRRPARAQGVDPHPARQSRRSLRADSPP